MSEDWNKYVNDKRTVCKYGSNCYQKNTNHINKYKHPPKEKRKLDRGTEPEVKRSRSSRSPENVKLEIGNKLEAEYVIDKSSEQHDSLEFGNKSPMSGDKTLNTAKQMICVCENYSNESVSKIIEDLFLCKLPQDFVDLWNCLKENCNSPSSALEKVNIELIGPYDALVGRLPKTEDKDLYLIHGRFFFDPPEFQAVLKLKGKSEYHIGYYRDSPNELPQFVASNDSAKDCSITPIADNIFGAVYYMLQNEKKKSPFIAMYCQKLAEHLKTYAEAHNYTLGNEKFKKRKPLVLAKTFHGAGIVAPYNKKTQLGYRPLVENYASIKKILSSIENAKTSGERDKALSELQPVITYANIAMDECDFGTGLELGIDLFCSGLKELNNVIEATLSTAYSLLNRSQFSDILQVHLKHRRKGSNLSILEFL